LNDPSILSLSLFLLVLIILSGFFSSAETSMLSLNRYRLKHLRKNGHKGAIKASQLLEKTDQLIGVILIGNNFVNILASSIATVVAIRLWGNAGIAIATAGLTIVILIFAEITPKTIAAYYPEKIAFPAAYVLKILLKIFYPLVWIINQITSFLLKTLGFDTNSNDDHLSREELKTLVNESGALIPSKHQEMLIGILDLEKVTVNDIMIPRNEITGIDIDDDIDNIFQHLKNAQHTRLPVYKNDINNIIGILHLRSMTRVLLSNEPNKASLLQACREPYFIPESTSLNTQLINFQQDKRRIGIVVDEYGDIQGLTTMEDILEEIVGEFTTDFSATSNQDIMPQNNGSFLIDGTTTIRAINKNLGWELPLNGPKTLNGLITNTLENIPDSPICLYLYGHRTEIRHIKDNRIKTAQMSPLNQMKQS